MTPISARVQHHLTATRRHFISAHVVTQPSFPEVLSSIRVTPKSKKEETKKNKRGKSQARGQTRQPHDHKSVLVKEHAQSPTNINTRKRKKEKKGQVRSLPARRLTPLKGIQSRTQSGRPSFAEGVWRQLVPPKITMSPDWREVKKKGESGN